MGQKKKRSHSGTSLFELLLDEQQEDFFLIFDSPQSFYYRFVLLSEQHPPFLSAAEHDFLRFAFCCFGSCAFTWNANSATKAT